MKIIDQIGGLLVKPEETVTALLHGAGSMVGSLSVVLLFSTALWVSLALSIKRLVEAALQLTSISTPGIVNLAGSSVIGAFVFIGLAHDLINYFLGGVVAHFVARLLDGAGELNQVIMVNGYTWVSLVFMLIGCIVMAVNFIAGVLITLGLLVVTWIWHVYLFTIGIAESHGISTGKALLAAVSWDILKLLLGVGLVSAFLR